MGKAMIEAAAPNNRAIRICTTIFWLGFGFVKCLNVMIRARVAKCRVFILDHWNGVPGLVWWVWKLPKLKSTLAMSIASSYSVHREGSRICLGSPNRSTLLYMRNNILQDLVFLLTLTYYSMHHVHMFTPVELQIIAANGECSQTSCLLWVVCKDKPTILRSEPILSSTLLFLFLTRIPQAVFVKRLIKTQNVDRSWEGTFSYWQASPWA